MARIVEKADGTLEIFVHLTLKPERDDAIIKLVRAAPARGLAGVVREAMRTGIGQNRKLAPDEGVEQLPFELPDLGIDL